MPRRVILVAVVLLVSASATQAQTLRDQVRQLFTFGTCGRAVCLDTTVLFGHGLHYIPATETIGATFVSFIATSIGISVSNTPISSSSSGTTFRFEGGVPVKTSTSAGPVFAERAQTLGRGRLFVGIGFSALNFERLRGVPLRRITLTLPHQDFGSPGTLGSPAFENDIIDVQVTMDVSLLVTSFSATYGLVDGVDLGVTVPFVRAAVSGRSEARVFQISGDTLHRFGGTGTTPVLTATSTAAGSATGVGDIEARLKINVAQSDRIGVALLGNARFPTGDAANLLGSDRFSARALGIVSGRFGNFNPHVNFGYTVRDAVEQNNSIEANAGFDALLSSWATLAFDVLGSWQMNDSKLDVPPPVVYQAPVQRTLDVTNIPSQRDDLMSMSMGFKFRTQRGLQIVTNALFPLRDSGLQPSVVWTGGLEYSF